MEYQNIPVSQIDASTHFQFIPSFIKKDLILKNTFPSIGKVLSQVIIKKDISSGKYLLVSDKHIYEEILQTSPSRTEIVCIILPHTVTSTELLQLLYCENKNAIENDIVTRSYFIQKCLEQLSHLETIAFFTELAMSVTKKDIQNAKLILNFDNSTQLHILHKRLSLSILPLLKKMSEQDCELIINIITELELGNNKQKRLLDLCIQLTIRDQISISKLFESNGIKFILETEDKNKPQMITLLLQELQDMCFPLSSKAYKEFSSRRASLNLPNQCKLEPTKAFEKDEVIFSICFSSMDEFERKWQGLKTLCES